MTKEQVFRAALEYAQDQNPGKAVVPYHGFVEGVKWAAEQLLAENEKMREENSVLRTLFESTNDSHTKILTSLNQRNNDVVELRKQSNRLRAALEAIIDRYDVANMLAGDDPIIEQARKVIL